MNNIADTNIGEIVSLLYNRYLNYTGKGKVADYIPTLSTVNPDQFAISVATVEGEHYDIGDYNTGFTIQSISKVFTLAMLSSLMGDDIWKYVGREPSGNSFNSLVQLEYEKGIPRNPFINAGALVISDKLMNYFKSESNQITEQSTRARTKEAILNFVKELSGSNDIEYDKITAQAEILTAERNFALAYFMKSFNNIDNSVKDVINTYCHQCSLKMNTRQLATAFLFLANGGINPLTGKDVTGKRNTKRINALMMTCGLYNESGDFAYRVGLPGKSGVGGGIVAVIPGRLSIAVWSPELNTNGNSCRGIATLEDFTTELGISVF